MTGKPFRPVLCLDFDGVVHSYMSGWQGPRTIPDPPVPGALLYMCEALETGWDVVIHSSRARYIGGIWAMRRWLKRHGELAGCWDQEAHGMGVPSLMDVRFVRWKPPATVTIDDRALTFSGTWPHLDALRRFKPWKTEPAPLSAIDTAAAARAAGPSSY